LPKEKIFSNCLFPLLSYNILKIKKLNQVMIEHLASWTQTKSVENKNRAERNWRLEQFGRRAGIANKVIQAQLPGAKLLDSRPNSFVEAHNLKLKLQKQNKRAMIEIISPKQMLRFVDKTYPPGSPDRPDNSVMQAYYVIEVPRQHYPSISMGLDSAKHELLERKQGLMQELQELLGPDQIFLRLVELEGHLAQGIGKFLRILGGEQNVKSISLTEIQNQQPNNPKLALLLTRLADIGFDVDNTQILYRVHKIGRGEPSIKKSQRQRRHTLQRPSESFPQAKTDDRGQVVDAEQSPIITKPLSELQMIDQLLNGTLDVSKFISLMTRVNNRKMEDYQRVDFSKSVYGRRNPISEHELTVALQNIQFMQDGLRTNDKAKNKQKLSLCLTLYSASLRILQSYIKYNRRDGQAFVDDDTYNLITYIRTFQETFLLKTQFD